MAASAQTWGSPSREASWDRRRSWLPTARRCSRRHEGWHWHSKGRRRSPQLRWEGCDRTPRRSTASNSTPSGLSSRTEAQLSHRMFLLPLSSASPGPVFHGPDKLSLPLPPTRPSWAWHPCGHRFRVMAPGDPAEGSEAAWPWEEAFTAHHGQRAWSWGWGGQPRLPLAPLTQAACPPAVPVVMDTPLESRV